MTDQSSHCECEFGVRILILVCFATNNSRMNDLDAQNALISLGFTSLEASIYCFLIQQPPSTGYRIAKALRKAPANVYSALSALQGKGALVVEAGEGSEYVAVPPKQLLDMLDHGFQETRASAERELELLERPVPDRRTFQIASFEQALAHAERLLQQADSIVLLDIFPGPYRRLTAALENAVERGVAVAMCVYDEDCHLPGALMAHNPIAQDRTSLWPGEHLNMVTDASHSLMAMFNRDCRRLIQAIASDSEFVACIQHSGLFAEIGRASSLMSRPIAESDLEPLALLAARPAGFAELCRTAAANSLDNRAGGTTRTPSHA